MSCGLDFTDDQVADVTRRLTQAQRRAVSTGKIEMGAGYWPLRNTLSEKKLFTSANRTMVLTPFGKAVQAAMQANRMS